MQHHRTALQHLNMALDAMIDCGDTHMIAQIAYPIHLCEVAILERQRAILNAHAEAAGAITASRDAGADRPRDPVSARLGRT